MRTMIKAKENQYKEFKKNTVSSEKDYFIIKSSALVLVNNSSLFHHRAVYTKKHCVPITRYKHSLVAKNI